jgi:hypothetical protein
MTTRRSCAILGPRRQLAGVWRNGAVTTTQRKRSPIMVPCSFQQIAETGRQRQQALLANAGKERSRLHAGRARRPDDTDTSDGGRPSSGRFRAYWTRLVRQEPAPARHLRAGRASG